MSEIRKVVGIDIYHGDKISDWAKLKTAVDFIYIKATEGDQFSDSNYKIERDMAQKFGIPCGSYHFYRSSKDPIEQANDFIKVVGELRVGELPPILDWETEDDSKDGFDIDEVQKYLDLIEAHFKCVPWIYGGYYFLKDKILPASFARYPLIVPRYGKEAETPAPWKKKLIWQDNNKASVLGVANRCDHNIFMGTIEELSAFKKV